MLNNGHVGGGVMSGPPQEGGYGQPGPGSDYGGNPYLSGPPNGLMGHHSGGVVCSQMTLNQNNPCPSNNVKPQSCSACSLLITDRYFLMALERYWHHNCLKCNACNVTLAELGSSFWTREGMILCRPDYLRMFGGGSPSASCNACAQMIYPHEYVMRAGMSHSGPNSQLVYHQKCFLCSKCGVKLSTGDRYSLINGALFCEQDALKMTKNGIGSPSSNVGSNGPAPTRKGKVGRPRRSRD